MLSEISRIRRRFFELHDFTRMWNLKISNTQSGEWKDGYRGRASGETGRRWSKGAKLQLCWMHKSRALMFSMMMTVNNTVLNTGNSLSGFDAPYHKKQTNKQKKVDFEEMDILICLIVVIISLEIMLNTS